MDELTRLRDRAYLDLLHYGLVGLRNYARNGRVELCWIEAEHLHEMPKLIGKEYEGAHEYYLRCTRKRWCSLANDKSTSRSMLRNRPTWN